MAFEKFKKAAAGAAIFAVFAVSLSGAALAAELPETLVPVGEAVGISIKTDGVMVSELSEFDEGGVKRSPAGEAGIRPGDIIVRIDGKDVSSAADMMQALEGVSGEVTVQFTREGKLSQVEVRPHMEEGDGYLGIWVRDGVTGIGTVTYFDPATGRFGALGHSIADSVTGMAVPLREGSIMPAEVTGVTKSRAGTPGQLGGVFDFDKVVGDIDQNCALGIFGTASEELGSEKLPTAKGSEVRVGPASIISEASGERKEYAVEIVRLYSDSPDGRDMMIKVTDEELIGLTGGIVQGMSGSPIIQDGRLVGAVTHVLINDPRKGYGVFIENMYEAAK